MLKAKELTLALSGIWRGTYGSAFCPAHSNTRTPALSVRDDGNGGVWLHCFAGCPSLQVADAISRLGLDVKGWRSYAKHAPSPHIEPHDAEAIARARRLWAAGKPSQGTAAEIYLREARAYRGQLPESLRFHPRAPNGVERRTMPAILAAVTLGDHIVAVQRTFITNAGAKAEIPQPRMLLGRPRGGAVHLSEGDGPLVVAEGIETALSLKDGFDNRASVWATLGTSGLRALKLPSVSSELIIGADGDAAGADAAMHLADAAEQAGWAVRIMHAPPGMDWNDVAVAGCRAT